jgi:large subunit ribosomal protein L22
MKKLAEERGVTREQLASAVERTGIEGPAALRAVNNWLGGKDHPRCKAADIRKLAAAVGASPKDVARFTSEVRYHRGSPRKARLLVDLVRGKGVDEALNLLRFTPKRAAIDVRKALSAALADAEQAEADVTRLVVVESRCDEGPRLKRFQPKDRGRAHAIIKRFSHITIAVEEKA